ncbi:MAG TPA: N-acetyl-alpha-D-glucosaminyl L-malate synthase BshA [Vicinamibacterales bacterium]|nr:N-acetyl-alpha-D-glucosaminyl L-malate synthase BshA [Vicinamibacterales bacterium]
MKIGMICYASVGGSGVVATELAHAMALRGHEVHLISSELPFRWRPIRGLSFERVQAPDYPLFREPQYLLGLANTLVRVAHERGLDILHAHYAVPHATAAYLAHQILAASDPAQAPRTVTTLHGTDITLVGSDPSYAGVVGFSIEESHGVTAVSESLRDDTVRSLGIKRDIRVIANFLDCDDFRRQPNSSIRDHWCAGGWDSLVVHISNFRPVKQVGQVLDIFARIRQQVAAKLVLIGDGPDRSALEHRAAAEGFGESVEFVGEQLDLVSWLSAADLLLLPSAQESFGMAALEAMACEVPVVASRVGGLPELVEDGVTGFLCAPGDVDGMAARSVAVLTDEALRARIGQAACLRARTSFCSGVVVPRYEAYYEEVLEAGRRGLLYSG